MHVDRSRLFHTIVVVGLASGAAACGGTTTSVALDGGEEGSAPEASAEASGDASPEAGFVFGGGDAGTDAPVLFVDADGATPQCDPSAHQPPCWPTYV